MSIKTAAQIRQEFLDFFAAKAHAITPSAPVVPQDDPTLLFTNAGMNQFKPIFLGEQQTYAQDGRQWSRAANSQKCIRVSGKHNDLEEVGIDTYHHTLFEMLGNWSFGDYFKEEAIAWAWELLVKEWGLDPDRLYATVFGGDEKDGLPVDDEAIELWKKVTSIKPENILRFGKKDNFWEMGDTGPCGPCSEIHVDLRSDEERAKVSGAELVNADDPRVMEIWNLVFIQFNRQPDGSLQKLPAQHVDTGMGFERICAVLQGKTSNYDSDVFQPLIQEIAALASKTYGKDEKTDIAIRVIADHIRAVSFGVADGASPSNDGRGYVIRRILRRAMRYGWDVLGLREPFMHRLVPGIGKVFEEVFPELQAQLAYVISVVKAEEESFLRTLGQGISLFEQVAQDTKEIAGEHAFKLHDTYGFPIDLTRLMARERGLTVDEAGFDRLMQEQKERARSAGRFQAVTSDAQPWNFMPGHTELSETKFTGYDNFSVKAGLIAWRPTDDDGIFEVVLDQTPFYAESGGQVADTGFIRFGDTALRVNDVRKKDGVFIHYTEGAPPQNSAECYAEIDSGLRTETQKNHTATHILHAVLRNTLGDHVAQKGSLVAPDKLRFDFSHFEAVTQEQLDQIEAQVNQKIQENIPLTDERNVPIEEAKSRGAMMLFGEKYGDFVRVVTFDPSFSVEFCGGTHVKATGEIGYFRFVSESSVASGIRRVEAVTGVKADALLRTEKHILSSLKKIAGAGKDPLTFVEELLAERKNLQREVKALKMEVAGAGLEQILSNSEVVTNGVRLIKGVVEGSDMSQLKQLGYDMLNREQSGTVCLLGTADAEAGKVYLMACVSDDLIKRGLKAGALVGAAAKFVGGGGGGQPNLATAGGKQPENLSKALENAPELIKSFLQN
ncbi:alanyl-tRNA synthetase [Cyclonatronum proteinivorum]|uniref:Alanine--tRNA ligase n=1 Tax=Cyclonatronum proteinivorum TaxID=1457365 RepID=A0A345UKM4_9BACT|nr:alanine--tRNA ligase [Cyclonatronum proteinivorum]AXJ01026.1 alanyl-tRNA synthetase [Cyclonatronum proteinivorum]